VLKVEGAPTFFIKDEMIVGETGFEELDKRIESMLEN
jgi:protein-disulfide isomerase